MATIKGRAVVWSTGGITMTAGIVNASNPNFPQSARFQRGSEKSEIKDDGGVIRTQVFHGFKKSLSLSVVPSAPSTSISAANVSADAHMPSPGTTINVTDEEGTIVGGNYNLISATQNRSVDGVATIDLEMEQGDESNDLTTPST